MERTPAFGSTASNLADASAGQTSPNPFSDKVESAALAAHQATDRIADTATLQVDRLSGTAHRAVNSAADAATVTAQWVSAVPQQVNRVQTRLTEAACASVRARPLQTVVGAVAVGYLLGRLARL
jgi:ElaB/YqjD/DUF883 family membrane-anchored ribosome-binding protein